MVKTSSYNQHGQHTEGYHFSLAEAVAFCRSLARYGDTEIEIDGVPFVDASEAA